jgi:hypothetical protein
MSDAAHEPRVRIRSVDMKFFYLIIGGLAAYRLSLMISKEDGPAYIFRRIRRLPPPETSAKAGLSCEWCMSIWAGALVALYLWLIGAIRGNEWPLYWLGSSALAIICNQQWTRGS